MRKQLHSEVEKQASLKLKRRKERRWREIVAFGMVGWAVAIPTVLGIMLGSWLDERSSSSISWTLILMLGGICSGCVVAWHWVEQNR